MLALSITAVCFFVLGVIAAGLITLWCEIGSKTAQLISDLEAENRFHRRQEEKRLSIEISEPPLEYSPERKWWEKNRFQRPR